MDCPECIAYEEAVMARRPEDPEPGPPCDHYEMSSGFQQWIVGRMQQDVTAQVQRAGLDRMGIVRAADPAPEQDEP